jgi:hypothetical protein
MIYMNIGIFTKVPTTNANVGSHEASFHITLSKYFNGHYIALGCFFIGNYTKEWFGATTKQNL